MKKTPLKRSGFRKKTYDEVKSQLATKKRTTRRISAKKGGIKTVSKLKKELWKLFSLFIRRRDNFKCVTCGKVGEGGGIHAGHFITGATCGTELYFDEMNVHAQCYHCNINLSGNWVKYENFMINKYGKNATEFLKLRRTLEAGIKVDTTWYEEKINHYKKISMQNL